MDKDKILDYVRKTPANTNPNVLKTMLDSDSSDEINPGYSCTEITTLLTDESVTTVFDDVMNSGILAYSTSIDADTIKVTFNGTEYVCNAEEALAGKTYGAPMGEEGVDWSEYPFQIASGLRNDLYTESAGTYQIKIETVEEVVETTPCFEKAVNSVIDGSGGSGGGTEPLIVSLTPVGEDDAILSKTWQEIYDAMSQGRAAFIVFANAGSETVQHYPIIEASPVGTTNYSVYFLTRNNETVSVQAFSCESADDQPSASGGGY